MRKKIIFLTLAATLSSHQSITFAADAYPSRPIRVITAVGPAALPISFCARWVRNSPAAGGSRSWSSRIPVEIS